MSEKSPTLIADDHAIVHEDLATLHFNNAGRKNAQT